MAGTLCARVAAACDRVLDGLGAGDTRAAVEAVRAGLGEPLRVAVAGRVNSGKSTLVNAILRQRVAPTDVSECTRLVTWFRFGVPEGVEVARHDGTRRRIPLRPDGSLPPILGVPLDQISHLVVHLSNEALRDLVLIDTPGLASVNDDNSRVTRELLALDSSSREAVAGADAIVYVLTSVLREDEARVLTAFRALVGDLTSSAVNAVAVLNKADQIGDGGPEAWPAAQRLADEFAGQLRSLVAAVVPLVGLLAETADAGGLTERDVADLSRLAELPPAARSALLLSADRFVSAPAPVPGEARARLLERLDLHGIAVAFDLLDAGPSPATALVQVLRERSGIDRLRRLLVEAFARNADALKASHGLAALERLAYAPPEPGSEARWSLLRSEIEEIRIDRAMHRLNEIRAVNDWACGAVALPAPLEDDLRRLTSSEVPAGRLG
ncbi:MAG: dynamin family protein, partial [Acidimicrobiia bacterium]